MGQSNPEWTAPVNLPSQHIGILKGIFAACLHAFERDLQKAERLRDPSQCQREFAAFERLLTGLEKGQLSGPDKAACDALKRLATASDAENNYAAVVAEHDALHGLLDRLKEEEG